MSITLPTTPITGCADCPLDPEANQCIPGLCAYVQGKPACCDCMWYNRRIDRCDLLKLYREPNSIQCDRGKPR